MGFVGVESEVVGAWVVLGGAVAEEGVVGRAVGCLRHSQQLMPSSWR